MDVLVLFGFLGFRYLNLGLTAAMSEKCLREMLRSDPSVCRWPIQPQIEKKGLENSISQSLNLGVRWLFCSCNQEAKLLEEQVQEGTKKERAMLGAACSATLQDVTLSARL